MITHRIGSIGVDLVIDMILKGVLNVVGILNDVIEVVLDKVNFVVGAVVVVIIDELVLMIEM